MPILIPLDMLNAKYSSGGSARPSAMGESHSPPHLPCTMPADSKINVAASAAIVLFTAKTTGK